MRSEDIRARGVALAERVHREVHVDERMGLLVGASRRRRTTTFALAAAAVVAAILGISTLAATTDDAPATRPTVPSLTAPPTTASSPPSTATETNPESSIVGDGLQSLPVEVWVVLLESYAVDVLTGECSGTGELAGLLAGSPVLYVDQITAEELTSVLLPSGIEVRRADAPPFLLPLDVDAGCVFELGDPGITDFDVRFASDPDVGISGTLSGQRLVIRLEG